MIIKRIQKEIKEHKKIKFQVSFFHTYSIVKGF